MKKGLLIAGFLICGGITCGQLDSIGINFGVFALGLIGMAICGGLLVECVLDD